MGLEAEIEEGQREGRLHRLLGRFRAFTHRHPVLRLIHKALVTLVGGAIALAGVVMLVTPGPGWLAIFLGLGVLATEYPVVHRFNQWAKGKVVAVWRGYRRRRQERRERRECVRAERSSIRLARRRHHDLLKARFHSRHSCAPHRSHGRVLVVPRRAHVVASGRLVRS